MADLLGIALGRFQYDKAGNLTQMAFHDANGELVAVAPPGGARIEFAYDEDGRLKKVIIFGADQRVVRGSQGFARNSRGIIS